MLIVDRFKIPHNNLPIPLLSVFARLYKRVDLHGSLYSTGCNSLEKTYPSHVVMEINSLPYDCLRAILKPNFSVSKLIRLRAVSKTWKKVIDDICRSKTELNLFNGLLDMVKVYKDADSYRLMKRTELKQLVPNLLTPSQDVQMAEFIARLFPHVTKLVCGLKNSYQVALLMYYWSGIMEDVTIIGKMHNRKHVRHFFWNALNSMPKLKRLVFHDITDTENYQHIPYAYFVPPFVTVFKQLEHFAITGRADQAYDIFGYKKPKPGQAVVAVAQKRQHHLMAAKLTHLVLTGGYTIAQPPIIKAILASTEAICHLDVSDLNLKLADLMPELQRKNNLESIRIKSTQLVPGNGAINSIKHLHLIDTTVAHWPDTTEKPDYRLLPLLFPSLEHLELAAKDAQLMDQVQTIIPRSVGLTFISTVNN